MTIRTDAIVLRRRSLREQDRVYTLYTRELGKVEALGRGARKIGSRMAGHLSSFGVVDVMLARGRAVDTLAGTDVLAGYPGIMHDPLRLRVALAGLSLLDLATRVHVRDAATYELTCAFLEYIDAEASDLSSTLGWYALQLTSRLGYEPMLAHCVICRGVYAEYPCFAPTAGGVVCADCTRSASDIIPMTTATVNDMRSGLIAAAPEPMDMPLREAIAALVQAHLELPWPGAAVLAGHI